MDPWYYNRLSNASSSFQPGTGASSSEYHHQLAGHPSGGNGNSTPPSPSQLLQQTQQTPHSSLLAPSPFNSGFLPPSPYNLSHLFAQASKSSPYEQQRALATAMASSKPATENELTVRESYSPAHHSSLASTAGQYFDHQNSAPSAVGWPHQSTPQFPSPFGILPHESVAASASATSTSEKTGSSGYPLSYAATNAALNHFSQLADYKSASIYTDSKKGSRSHSPGTASKSVVPNTGFYSPASNTQSSGYVAPHQSCIVSAPSATSTSKDYRMQQPSSRVPSVNVYQDTSISRDKQGSSRSPNFVPPSTKSSHIVHTKAQAKVYPDSLNTSESPRTSESLLDTNQSSRVSVSVIDSSRSPRYASGHVSSHAKQLTPAEPTQHLAGNQTSTLSYQPTVNHQGSTYRQYPNPTVDTDFHRSKSSSTESSYNSASPQNSSECGLSTSRTSPQVSHSQPSPLGHVQSPAYPMYNSPMAPMASPSPLQHLENTNTCHQNSSSVYKSVTSSNPTVPLDTKINLAYPSVITRSLSSDALEKPSVYHDARSYDRSHDQSLYSKQCWDAISDRQSSVIQPQNSSSHSRKYQSAPNSVPSYNVGTSELIVNASQHQQVSRASASTSEKQHLYYDGSSAHQAALQDLSSCRGDPMSIVKNLQNLQQQTCHTQSIQEDSRSGIKTSSAGSDSPNSNKRRRSADKQAHAHDSSEYYTRVPPPAHHNSTSQQQQNGNFFSNYLSPPSTSRPYAGSQTPMHHVSNAFVGNQHQGLYMSPFFPPFPLSGPSSSSPSPSVASQASSSSENQSTSVLRQTSYPESPTQAAQTTTSQSHLQETASSKTVGSNVNEACNLLPNAGRKAQKTPKVVVPNIEEELSFLANAGPITMVKSEQERKKNMASGFEASYLKFLQGERETSPPPNNRGARKSTWPKTRNLTEVPKQTPTDVVVTNGGPKTKGTTVIPSTSAAAVTPVYNSEDDPRYFPLPKTDAQRKSLESSDSDSSSDMGSFNSISPKNQSSKTQDHKPIAAVAPRTASRQSPKVTVTNSQSGKKGRKKKSEVSVPRRETSKRKAKEKGSILLVDVDDDYPNNPREFADSDSDPAWTPAAPKVKNQNIESSDEESLRKKGHRKGSKSAGSGRKRSRHGTSEGDGNASSEDEKPRKRNLVGPKGRRRSLIMQSASGSSHSIKSGDDIATDVDEAEMYPFKIGEFVVMKTDLSEKWPPIWRVDGKTLLQKFEPFDHKGEMLYRNISTYSGWSPQNRHIYRSAQVRFQACNKTETIVEFLREDMAEEDEEALEKLVNETAKFQDNFEVYIQTLISQALDSNFLTEIFQEQDDYFLRNVKIVDDIVDDHRKRFLGIVKWRQELEASIATWPCYNVMFELVADDFRKNCAACDKPRVTARVLLYGQPYNSTTLEGCQADPKLVSEKDFLTCRLCLSRIELYNKVAHQKYLMYIECAKRVNERRIADSSKDTTVILNELLADDKWLNQLFRNVRISWAEMKFLEVSKQKK